MTQTDRRRFLEQLGAAAAAGVAAFSCDARREAEEICCDHPERRNCRQCHVEKRTQGEFGD